MPDRKGDREPPLKNLPVPYLVKLELMRDDPEELPIEPIPEPLLLEPLLLEPLLLEPLLLEPPDLPPPPLLFSRVFGET